MDFETCDKYNFNVTTQTLLYITAGRNRPTYGREFDKNKEGVKHDIANILFGPSKEFDDFFDLEKEMPKDDRLKLMDRLFRTDIQRLTEKLLSREGIIELYKTGQIFLLPAVKVELWTD